MAEADVRGMRAEDRGDMVGITPQRRGFHERRRGRQVRGEHLEERHHIAPRRPPAHTETPTRAQHAQDLRGRHGMTGGEHAAERRHDDVGGAVRQGQGLGIALDEGEFDARGACAGAGPGEHLGGEIDAGDPRAGLRRLDGDVPRAAADVHHLVGAADREVLHQHPAGGPGALGDPVELAGAPRGALACPEVIDGAHRVLPRVLWRVRSTPFRPLRARAIGRCAVVACVASADVAQLVERRLPKPKVAGSNPVVRSSGAAAISHSGRRKTSVRTRRRARDRGAPSIRRPRRTSPRATLWRGGCGQWCSAASPSAFVGWTVPWGCSGGP